MLNMQLFFSAEPIHSRQTPFEKKVQNITMKILLPLLSIVNYASSLGYIQNMDFTNTA